MLRALIVDDEHLARERLRALLADVDADIEVVGEASGGKEAVVRIHETQPDVVFLDVQMPVLNGFDVLDLLPAPRPHIVFVTAFDEYALQAFEVHALDYLTKPVRRERLAESLAHVQRLAQQGTPDDALAALDQSRAARPLQRMTVQVGQRLRIIAPDDVRYFEAEDKVVFAHLKDGGRHIVDFTLKTLERRLDAAPFLRTHRSYLINMDHIAELIPWFSDTYQVRLTDGTTLPVARRRAADVKQLLGGR